MLCSHVDYITLRNTDMKSIETILRVGFGESIGCDEIVTDGMIGCDEIGSQESGVGEGIGCEE